MSERKGTDDFMTLLLQKFQTGDHLDIGITPVNRALSFGDHEVILNFIYYSFFFFFKVFQQSSTFPKKNSCHPSPQLLVPKRDQLLTYRHVSYLQSLTCMYPVATAQDKAEKDRAESP